MKKLRFFTVGVLWVMMFASCASISSKRSFGPYSEAEGFYKKGNYPKAIEKYQEYIAVDSQGNLAATAQYYVAKSYVASGDAVQARENFEKVVKQYPGTSWASFAKEQLEILDSAAKT